MPSRPMRGMAARSTKSNEFNARSYANNSALLSRSSARSSTNDLTLQTLGSLAAGRGVHAGREAGVDFCGPERRDGFGCAKDCDCAILVAKEPRAKAHSCRAPFEGVESSLPLPKAISAKDRLSFGASRCPTSQTHEASSVETKRGKQLTVRCTLCMRRCRPGAPLPNITLQRVECHWTKVSAIPKNHEGARHRGA